MPEHTMTPDLMTNGDSSFRIKRPLATTAGFVSEVDPTVTRHLDELNELLGKRVFQLTDGFEGPVPAERGKLQKDEKETASPRRVVERGRLKPSLWEFLSKPLKPKTIPDTWADGSLLKILSTVAEPVDGVTLSEYMDINPDLAGLKTSVISALENSWYDLDFNTKAVLEDHPAIRDYLIAAAFQTLDLTDVKTIKNFIVSGREGAKKIATYAVVSATRTIIDKEGLEVDKFNEDDSAFVKKVGSLGLSLSALSFRPTILKRISEFRNDTDEAKIIEGAGLGTLPPELKPKLIRQLQNSPVKITEHNIKFFLPTFIKEAQGVTHTGDVQEVEFSTSDFEVQFPSDETSQIQINVAAVKCAAQLYYVMVLGDELEVFNTINYFTHNYLVRERMDIEDRTLRQLLRMYVFDNKFSYVDGTERVVAERTRPAERHMFYQQCFDEGGREAQAADLVVRNREFKRLWKILILESAKYLERARESFHPNSYVSKQNVMQAVEDLQYNLSTHCTGMAHVITPLMYEELNFVTRIFMRKDVVQQVVPSGSGWVRVVEKLYEDMRRSRPKASALFNKAKLGHQIIRAVAEYNPDTFEENKNFSTFISLVDAFITTQSILQESLTDDLVRGDEEQESPEPTMKNGDYAPAGVAPPSPGPGPSAEAGDEWDF